MKVYVLMKVNLNPVLKAKVKKNQLLIKLEKKLKRLVKNLELASNILWVPR